MTTERSNSVMTAEYKLFVIKNQGVMTIPEMSSVINVPQQHIRSFCRSHKLNIKKATHSNKKRPPLQMGDNFNVEIYIVESYWWEKNVYRKDKRIGK